MTQDKNLEVDRLVVLDDVRVIHFHLLVDVSSIFARSLVAVRRRQVLVLAAAVHVRLFLP